jgi:hypothetical protein
VAPGGSVKTGGLGDGSRAGHQAIGKLRLTLPPGDTKFSMVIGMTDSSLELG